MKSIDSWTYLYLLITLLETFWQIAYEIWFYHGPHFFHYGSWWRGLFSSLPLRITFATTSFSKILLLVNMTHEVRSTKFLICPNYFPPRQYLAYGKPRLSMAACLRSNSFEFPGLLSKAYGGNIYFMARHYFIKQYRSLKFSDQIRAIDTNIESLLASWSKMFADSCVFRKELNCERPFSPPVKWYCMFRLVDFYFLPELSEWTVARWARMIPVNFDSYWG